MNLNKTAKEQYDPDPHFQNTTADNKVNICSSE